MRPAADVRSGGRTFRALFPGPLDQPRVFLGRRRRSSPLTLLFGASRPIYASDLDEWKSTLTIPKTCFDRWTKSAEPLWKTQTTSVCYTANATPAASCFILVKLGLADGDHAVCNESFSLLLLAGDPFNPFAQVSGEHLYDLAFPIDVNQAIGVDEPIQNCNNSIVRYLQKFCVVASSLYCYGRGRGKDSKALAAHFHPDSEPTYFVPVLRIFASVSWTTRRNSISLRARLSAT